MDSSIDQEFPSKAALKLVQLTNLAQQGTVHDGSGTRMSAGEAGRSVNASHRHRPRIRVLVADSQPLYREAMTRAIRERPELELIGQAGDGREALSAIGKERPDVAVLDRTLPGLTGEQILNAVGRDSLGTRLVLMAAEPESGLVYTAIAKGAGGYLTKRADGREVCDAITAVARGGTVLAPELQTAIAGEIRVRATFDRPLLSEREGEILKLVADGLSAPAIGRRLHLSPPTVKTHLQHVYDKLDVNERAAAVAEAMRRGLIE